jgi:hypothetical protein
MAEKQTKDEEEDETNFTHVGLRTDTKKKITILAKVLGRKQYRLLQIWTDDAWNLAKKAGLVTDAMLEPDPDLHWVGITDAEKEGLRKLVNKTTDDKGKK